MTELRKVVFVHPTEQVTKAVPDLDNSLFVDAEVRQITIGNAGNKGWQRAPLTMSYPKLFFVKVKDLGRSQLTWKTLLNNKFSST